MPNVHYRRPNTSSGWLFEVIEGSDGNLTIDVTYDGTHEAAIEVEAGTAHERNGAKHVHVQPNEVIQVPFGDGSGYITIHSVADSVPE